LSILLLIRKNHTVMKTLRGKILLIFCVLYFQLFYAFAQNDNKNPMHIEPPNWWVGMKNTSLQLLVHAKDISSAKVSLIYPGVELKQVTAVESPNYLFLTLNISPLAKAGTFPIEFKTGKKSSIIYNYELKARKAGSAERTGFNTSDAFYLIMSDRFCNADTSNDNMPGMTEKANRSNPDGRHGGDLKGIESKLSYISDLGFTTVWMTPFLENNQKVYSYHGYSITDFYKTDPRFGTNEDFFHLVNTAHNLKMKVVMDMVFNHCGSFHWWINDLPAKDWINQWNEFTRTNYHASTVMDYHASANDRDKMVRGWFDNTMPDLNQNNPLMATYLIQNTIWWVEAAGLDGIRVDTYPYPCKYFMATWAKSVMDEYPNLNIVGEVWMAKTSLVAYYQQDAPNRDGYNSHLPSVFDFPMFYAIGSAFNENESWDKGLVQLYDVLSEDFLYTNTDNIIVFANNHDTERGFSIMKEDIRKYKMMVAFLFTIRGIPLMYYGDEILITGKKDKGDGDIRKDFPGGWADDKMNAFSSSGRTNEQNEAFNYLQRIAKWRSNKTVVQNGKLLHYLPEDGIYVYFRYNDNESVMVVLNNNESPKDIKTARFAEGIKDFTKARDIINNKNIENISTINIPAKSALIFELKK